MTYLVRDNIAVGYNTVCDPKKQNIDKYDAGIVWSPVKGCYFGAKHDSVSTDKI